MLKRISLNSFKFFYYVAMYESVTIASEKLFVTQGAVSRQIKNIEDGLNCKLFIRKGKTLELTNEGLLLLNCCQSIFHEIDKCLIKLDNKQADIEDLVISCESTLCMKWLIPRIKNFNDLNSGFELKIITNDGVINFGDVDIAIRRNDFHWKEHIYSLKLMDEIMFFVQSPSKKTEDILISSSRQKFWGSLLKINHISDKITQLNYKELDHFYLCIEACLSGLGSTIVSGYMVEKYLENGQLQPVAEPFLDGSSYYMLSAAPLEEDYRKIVFRNWLTKELNNSQNDLEKYFNIKKRI
ncbi:LysR family transcriptional regulator [Acinetobacter sp.]|uniref:LysR family transcriptional regulator n=1 Tax=Acinetobacter sp. TaxID=472 RepID=UPI002828AEC5|nr:LysR family transcriptional regulator [Acinetobacter sp.]MDR0235130.1 LysR family transcriptional regulator [Acinetobacter sp.]